MIAAGCSHQAIIIGRRKPNEVPEFGWVNTILGNLKTSFSGAYHAFDFAKYATRYLAAFAYRLTGAFTSTPFLPAAWSPLPLSDRGLPIGFGRLKNLANQVKTKKPSLHLETAEPEILPAIA